MAKPSNPLIGKTANKIGGVVFSTWKGLNVLREKPASVANPRTDPQVRQRSAITQAVELGRQVLGTLNMAFRSVAVHMSGFNAFVKYNVPSAFTFAGSVATLDPSKLVFSRGPLAPVTDSAITDNSDGTYSFTWDPNTSGAGASATDPMYASLYDPAGKLAWSGSLGVARSVGTAGVDVDMPPTFAATYGAIFPVSAVNGSSADSATVAVS